MTELPTSDPPPYDNEGRLLRELNKWPSADLGHFIGVYRPQVENGTADAATDLAVRAARAMLRTRKAVDGVRR